MDKDAIIKHIARKLRLYGNLRIDEIRNGLYYEVEFAGHIGGGETLEAAIESAISESMEWGN